MSFTFEGRKEMLLNRCKSGKIKIDIAEDKKTSTAIGYCVRIIADSNEVKKRELNHIPT